VRSAVTSPCPLRRHLTSSERTDELAELVGLQAAHGRAAPPAHADTLRAAKRLYRFCRAARGTRALAAER
jgi:hypothetical protein